MKLPASGLHYLALGHSHSASGLKRAGKTYYAWPGCPEGRGFDETGDKGVYLGQLEGGRVSLDFVPLARRRYLTPSLDITGQDPAQALEALIRASGRRTSFGFPSPAPGTRTTSPISLPSPPWPPAIFTAPVSMTTPP